MGGLRVIAAELRLTARRLRREDVREKLLLFCREKSNKEA